MVRRWDWLGFLDGSVYVGFPLDSRWIPVGFPLDSRWIPVGFPLGHALGMSQLKRIPTKDESQREKNLNEKKSLRT
jgi:hypothetical protein